MRTVRRSFAEIAHATGRSRRRYTVEQLFDAAAHVLPPHTDPIFVSGCMYRAGILLRIDRAEIATFCGESLEAVAAFGRGCEHKRQQIATIAEHVMAQVRHERIAA